MDRDFVNYKTLFGRWCRRPDELSLAEAAHYAQHFAGWAAEMQFNVNFAEILAKLAHSDRNVFFLANRGELTAFGSLLNPTNLMVADQILKLTYVNGLIVNPQHAHSGLAKDFLAFAGESVDLVAGHTQNPRIVAAFRKVFQFVWPTEDRTSELGSLFADAIEEYMAKIGRPRGFDRTTGHVANLYPHTLYNAQDTSGGVKPLEEGGDGILIIGFKDPALYRWIMKHPASHALQAEVVAEEVAPW